MLLALPLPFIPPNRPPLSAAGYLSENAYPRKMHRALERRGVPAVGQGFAGLPPANPPSLPALTSSIQGSFLA